MPRAGESSQASAAHSISDDDLEKMVSDAVFYLLIADQKKSLVKVREQKVSIISYLLLPFEKSFQTFY